MRKKRLFVFLFAIFAIFVLGFLIVNNFGRTGLASLTVNSNPSMEVFVDGKDVGKSSYTLTHVVGQVVLKLGSYETTLDLHPGIKTIVDRDFASDGVISSGEILSLESSGEAMGSAAFVSEPIGASVFIDDIFKGNAPLEINNLASKIYKVTVKADGYSDRSFKIESKDNYKLTVDVDLARSVSNQVQTSPEVSALSPRQMIKILSTPNGFLRVRNSPTTGSLEIGEVHTGESYALLSTDKDSGWFEIAFSATATSSGWISNTYAALVKPN